MLIAHLSDFHVFSDVKETAPVRDDAANAARAVVRAVVDHTPDLVLISGDLADGGSPADYALIRDILAPLTMPVLAVPGNHDHRDHFIAAFADMIRFDGGFAQFDRIIKGLRVIGLDTMIPGDVRGELCDARLDWLEQRLAQPHDGPTCLMMHHPVFPTGLADMDGSLIRGADRLAALIRHRDLYIIAGHVHRPVQTLWQGHLCAIGGGPAFQHVLDFDHAPGFVTEPYVFYLHRLLPCGSVTIHPCHDAGIRT
ncbi:metallophosphoesterase [Paracoccus sp. (in: a-proteobacteria)]|uniref:metallophosphoesterase n=1 Tax=Paracoccus sp. TaxID=267 RepID=UPI0026E05FDB|nr:metallophosphoesterase [Paracoccus sp. (in: a-proteobacteria)]MDO5646780.1 metallophosphoesterase [Paracoccus sp. (in: a-proteobacteria)]